MAPADQKMKNKKFTAKDGNWKKSKNNAQGVKKKRKWVPEHKVFEGSVKEGQGFALKRKQKVKHEYNKLLRKEKKKNPESKPLYEDEYPEHLRHLYMAEAEQLKNAAWTNRMNRSKQRMKGQEKGEERGENDAAACQSEAADPDPEVTGGSELTDSVTGNPEPTAASEKESLPMSNRMRKKMLKKTSYQKTKEEFETIKEKRKNKKEEYLKNKQQREEAIQKYKEKKMETFQMLSKKTKKGQPNLNLQMEYLLQKIQRTEK
ncbi:thyroid transcription factor 1-associated protein 26 homolog isoform X1 [Siniperca chuatsi]|uniref:thyroid transcription factor 1-associated protein 26 homolog isoform X1 n=1 Tax=Siniperca chuatsi TaxID=119488 RepID=UPI001CE1E132|nr:thyroid transcription factor 1-associated protein 26 homolog isoform X1 [Siniperca chuatsi]